MMSPDCIVESDDKDSFSSSKSTAGLMERVVVDDTKCCCIAMMFTVILGSNWTGIGMPNVFLLNSAYFARTRCRIVLFARSTSETCVPDGGDWSSMFS
jgi:hypothetical protein